MLFVELFFSLNILFVVAYRRSLRNSTMDSSIPTRDGRTQRRETTIRPAVRTAVSGELDATVRIPPLDFFRLCTQTEPRDYDALNAIARQITAARTRPYLATSQASSCEVLRSSRPPSPVGLTDSGFAPFAAFRPFSVSQPNLPTVPRFPPPIECPKSFVDTIGEVLQQFAAQSATQSAAQSEQMLLFFGGAAAFRVGYAWRARRTCANRCECP